MPLAVIPDRMRQRTKLAVALVVLALVMSGVVVGGVELFRADAQEEARSTTQQTARTIANQITEEINAEAEQLQELSTVPSVQNRSAVDRNLRAFSRHSSFRTVVFVAPNETITEARGIREDVRPEVIGSTEDAAYIGRALDRADSRAEIGPVGYDNVNDEFRLEIAHPVTQNGTNVGVIAGAVPVSEVAGSVTAVDAQDRTAMLSAWNGTATQTIRAPNGTFEQSLTRNWTVDFQGTDWVVTVIQSQEPLNDRLQLLTRIQLGSLFVIFASMIGLGYWEYSTNLRQTERLLDGFSELRDGNYEYTLSLSSATEWQRISEGYNELTFGLREREEEIREREQQLEVLNRVLRHNLQNDMNVIIGHAEMLPQFSDDDRVEDASETIVRMGEELVSHGQKARQLESVMGEEAEIRNVDVVSQVRSVLDAYRREYPDVEFRADLPVRADARVLETIEVAVDNLVENAAQYNDNAEPVVEVAVESTDGRVSMQIRDNGPGIPDHETDVLQSGAETALKHGSGIGLWLAFWLVDRSAGTMTFENNSPRGTVVIIDLPAAGEHEEFRESESEETERGDRTVLAKVSDRLQALLAG